MAFRLKFHNILNHNIYFVHWDAYKCISIIKFGWVVLTLALKFLCLETLASETRNETCDFSTPFWPLLAHIFVCILRRSYYICTKYMEQLYNYVLRRHHIKLYIVSIKELRYMINFEDFLINTRKLRFEFLMKHEMHTTWQTLSIYLTLSFWPSMLQNCW